MLASQFEILNAVHNSVIKSEVNIDEESYRNGVVTLSIEKMLACHSCEKNFPEKS